MIRNVALLKTVVLTCSALSVAGAVPGRQTTFRARTDAVSVHASIKQGRVPVGNLTSSDFVLTDNGVEQTVEALWLDRVPIDLTLVLAGYHARNPANTTAYFRGLTNASAIRQSLLPQDRLRAVWVQTEVRGGFVSNEVSLLGGDPAVPREFGVSLVDGLFYALAWPVEPHRRHLVVAFADGRDTASALAIEALPRLAAHSDAVLHVVFWSSPADGPVNGLHVAGGVGVSANPTDLAAWEADRARVSEAVQRTGGMMHRASDSAGDLKAIVKDFRTSYVLQYTPRGVQAAGWHEVRVRVTRPGRFEVRARQGYEIRRD